MRPTLIEVAGESESREPSTIVGASVGRLVGFDEAGDPLVHCPEAHDDALVAKSTVVLTHEQIGREVVLMFEHGDATKPLILGVIQTAEAHQPEPAQAQVDNERLEFNADREIVLKCGKASLTLTRAGKVLIRGAYVLSRSSGVNQLKGGSVHINRKSRLSLRESARYCITLSRSERRQ